MRRYAFNSKDQGCWADGAYGHDHIRRRLAILVGLAEPDNDALQDALSEEPSDDGSEEDEAMAFLQRHTEPGSVWVFDGGDLLLVSEAEWYY